MVKFHQIHTTTKIIKNSWFQTKCMTLNFNIKQKCYTYSNLQIVLNNVELVSIGKKKNRFFYFLAAWFRFCPTVRRFKPKQLLLVFNNWWFLFSKFLLITIFFNWKNSLVFSKAAYLRYILKSSILQMANF